MSDIGTGAESAVNDAVNSAANATDGPFAVYVRKARPNMREASTLQGEHWRIGILTESLIRFEWSDSGKFEDNLRRWWSTAILAPTSVHGDASLLTVESPAILQKLRMISRH